jgi:hypothetical protein
MIIIERARRGSRVEYTLVESYMYCFRYRLSSDDCPKSRNKVKFFDSGIFFVIVKILFSSIDPSDLPRVSLNELCPV